MSIKFRGTPSIEVDVFDDARYEVKGTHYNQMLNQWFILCVPRETTTLSLRSPGTFNMFETEDAVLKEIADDINADKIAENNPPTR